MGTPAQIGKSEWNAAIAKGRDATTQARLVLRKAMREGDMVMKAIAGQVLLEIGDMDEALYRLEEIGRNTK